jgi:hypothetical protein
MGSYDATTNNWRRGICSMMNNMRRSHCNREVKEDRKCNRYITRGTSRRRYRPFDSRRSEKRSTESCDELSKSNIFRTRDTTSRIIV